MLLRNRAVLFLLATVFLVGIGITCLINLMPVILESVGGNVSHQGIALLVSAMLEVPFLFLSVKMTRLDPHQADFALHTDRQPVNDRDSFSQGELDGDRLCRSSGSALWTLSAEYAPGIL